MKTIEEAIKQKKFKSARQKAHVNVLYTGSYINSVNNSLLKPFGISPQQFNILRILKGQHPNAASVKTLTERMLDKTSNASRLVDKLLEKALVIRTTCPNDRRQVDVMITESGIQLLDKANKVIAGQYISEDFSEEDAEQLSYLLDKLRATLLQSA
jgi:DNA-binding MarR family transcriptional regulator